METIDRLARLDAVSRHLAFGLDDHRAANEAYLRWRTQGDPAALEAIEVWAYCYVQRHTLVRFAREPRLGGGAELDGLISSTFLYVRGHLGEVRDPNRFSHWVAVACRNGFLTYCRHRSGRPPTIDLEGAAEPVEEETDAPLEIDRSTVRAVVNAAIGRLPDTLRVVATMRLVEGRPYDDIAYTTGHPQPTVRSYVSKAIARLKADPELYALREELAGAVPAPAGGVRR